MALALEAGSSLTAALGTCAERAPDGALRRAWSRSCSRSMPARNRSRRCARSISALGLRAVQHAGRGAALGGTVRHRSGRRCCANGRVRRPRNRFARAERLARAAPLKLWATLMLCHRAVHAGACWRFRWRACWRSSSGAERRRGQRRGSVPGRRSGRRLICVSCFERQQIFGPVDVELGARHGQAHQPVDVPLQQHLRAAIAAQLVQFAKTPARKDRRHADGAGVLRGGDATRDCAATRRRGGADLRWSRPPGRRARSARRRRSAGACARPSRMELAIPSAQSRFTATRARAVPEQRREFAGMRAEHHGHGVTGELHGAAHDGVHERAAVDAHQLFGGAEARRCARGQHHDVDVARLDAPRSRSRRISAGEEPDGERRRPRRSPAIMAVLPAISAKAERGITSSTTRMVMAASARMVRLARTRATPLWLRISDSVFWGSRFMAADITPVAAAGRRPLGPTVKRVAFGGGFLRRRRAPAHAQPIRFGASLCLLFNGLET